MSAVPFVTGIALVIDLVTAFIVYRGSHDSINMKAAFLHNVSDALASVGVIVAGVLILLYDLFIADLVITLIIAGYVIWQGLTLMPRTVRLLMGAVPDDVEFDRIVKALEEQDGVRSVHHLHVWNLGEHARALEAHLVLETDTLAAFEDLKSRVKEDLAVDFHIQHATLEPCQETECEPALIAEHRANRGTHAGARHEH